MQSRLLAIFTLLLFSSSLAAQPDSTASSRRYFLSVHAGGLLGKTGNGTSLTCALIQGVRYKRFAFGAGAGYDAYPEWRMVPFFGSATYDLVRGRQNALYVGLNSGFSKAWNPLFEQAHFDYRQTGAGGFFIHPLVGYNIVSGDVRLYIGVGYKVQRLVYHHIIEYWNPGTPDSKVTYRREMQRLSMQIGFGFR